jgi:excisionase family DNA binding protein
MTDSQDTPSHDGVWTVEDVMRFLKLSRTTIYELMDEGLPSVKIGGSRRFDRRDIVQWWEERKKSA